MEEVAIASLKITAEDSWLEAYIDDVGCGVDTSPNYLTLIGVSEPLIAWFEYRGLNWVERMNILDDLLEDIKKNGQKEPIFIYKDGRINNGHKRSACMLYLGFNTIKARIVPDDYKL